MKYSDDTHKLIGDVTQKMIKLLADEMMNTKNFSVNESITIAVQILLNVVGNFLKATVPTNKIKEMSEVFIKMLREWVINFEKAEKLN